MPLNMYLCFHELQWLRFYNNYSLKTFNKKELFLDIFNGYFEAAYVGSAQIIYTAAYFWPCRTYMMEPSCIINQMLVVNTFYTLPNVEEDCWDIHAPFPLETYNPDCPFHLSCSVGNLLGLAYWILVIISTDIKKKCTCLE